jgi:hypothetical protein
LDFATLGPVPDVPFFLAAFLAAFLVAFFAVVFFAAFFDGFFAVILDRSPVVSDDGNLPRRWPCLLARLPVCRLADSWFDSIIMPPLSANLLSPHCKRRENRRPRYLPTN